MRSIHCLALSCCLMVGAAAAQTNEEPTSGGTFNTPGYPAATPQRTPSTNPQTNQRGTTTSPDSIGTPTLRSPQNMLPNQPNGLRQGLPQQGDLGERRPEPTPPKPSEFQKFVEVATGRMLPVFGSSFFTEQGERQTVDNVPL